MLGLALFLGQMASASELVVLRLLGWETYLMRLKHEVNQNLNSVSLIMVCAIIMEFRLLLLIIFLVKYDHVFVQVKLLIGLMRN
jgi:hypothetical protein